MNREARTKPRLLPGLMVMMSIFFAAAAFASKSPTIHITPDSSEAPDMAGWLAQAKAVGENYYPTICKLLADKGFTPPTKLKLCLKKDWKEGWGHVGVAFIKSEKVNLRVSYFREHPEAFGFLIHEMAHIVMHYGKDRPPRWISEGIADWVRWFNYEPESRRPHLKNPQKAKYTTGYTTTAQFFDWIVKNKNKAFVTRLNAACRKGQYRPELFKELAGKPVDDLWAEFINSVQQK